MLLQAAKEPGSSILDDGQDSGDNSGVEDPDQEPAEDGNGESSGKRLMQLKSRHIGYIWSIRQYTACFWQK